MSKIKNLTIPDKATSFKDLPNDFNTWNQDLYYLRHMYYETEAGTRELNNYLDEINQENIKQQQEDLYGY